jgi:hypothetical protein
MEYLLLIYSSETDENRMDPKKMDELMQAYGAFTHSIAESGHFKAGDGLQPVSTATTVRVREGKTLTTDGPFAETREQLGGYYLIEAANLDEALAIAARIPSAEFGSIEVRPIWPTPTSP